MQTKVKPEASIDLSEHSGARNDVLCALIVAAISGALTALWFLFDHHYPFQDEAGHILNSIAFRDLLLKLRPWNAHWWYQFLTVNRCYPPSIYVTNAVLMLIFGTHRWVESLAMVLYSMLLTVTVYSTTRLLNLSIAAAAAAALLINTFPEVSLMSHAYMLDMPLLAMVSLGIMLLLWWQVSPTWKRSTTCGLLLGYVCLSKQIAAAYLFPAGLAVTFIILHSAKDSKDKYAVILKSLLIASLTVAIGLPFVLINYSFARDLAQYAFASYSAKHISPTFVGNLFGYAAAAVRILSPPVCVLFLASLALLDRKTHTRLIPLTASMVGGFLAMSVWPALADDRYLLPAAVAPAIYSGCLLAKFYSSGKFVSKAATAVVCSIIAVQYVSLNFYPYPIAGPPALAQMHFGVPLTNDACWSPRPLEDWGQTYVLDTIRQYDGSKRVYLNVLSNAHDMNAHSFELLCKEEGRSVQPTSSLIYNLVGDKVSFSPQTTMYYDWFLIKTGPREFPLFDKESADNYNRLVGFLEKSGKFGLIGRRHLPDNSEFQLYRKID